ncbi:MAG TPA: MYXO-CTERM sorting domain-containing protein [Polyangia bacterium]|nr:MYXO-CTERM sorting domain-containing protein [Polyangia bacterium]
MAPQNRAWTFLVPAGLSLVLLSSFGGGGCGQIGDGATSTGNAGAQDDGSLRGELATYVSDDFDGNSETRYALRDASGAERPLLFDEEPDFAPGTPLRVWGVELPDGLHVTRAAPITSGLESEASALRVGPPYAPRSFAFVLVDLGGGVNTTATDVMGRLITAPDSIRNYYVSDSYGTQDVTAQVFGPISYGLGTGCDTSQLAGDLRPMIQGTFQHYLWYFGSRQSTCGWTGLASVGTPDKPSRDTWYNASTSCVVLVQEPGHNFGMQHSSSLACTGASFVDDPNTCVSSEYGDPFDPMGSGCRHMNAWQKDYEGWFGGCNGVTVQSSGTFTVLPLEQACDGVQFLQIVSPKVRTFNRPAGGGGMATVETFSHYYVELRTPQDFDGMLGNRSTLAPEVLVHVGGDLRARSQRGLHTFLLDMTPTTTGRAGFADAALGLGKTFSDPAGGLDVTVVAVSATQATIAVNMPGGAAGPTCLDGTAFTAPGPGPESCNAIVGGAGGAPGAADAGGIGGEPGEAGAAGPSLDAGAAGATGSADPSPTGAGGMAQPGEASGVVGHGCGCEASGRPPLLPVGVAGIAIVGVLGRRRRRR